MMEMLNYDQFKILMDRDISCTIHPETVLHEEKISTGVRVTPCVVVSCMVTNFHVPVVVAGGLGNGRFQKFTNKEYRLNYSEQCLDLCLLELKDKYPANGN